MGHEVFFFIYKRSQKLLDIGNFASVCTDWIQILVNVSHGWRQQVVTPKDYIGTCKQL